MEAPTVEIVELGDRRFLLEIEDRPDALGPLTRQEILAIAEAIDAWLSEGEY